MVEDLTKEVLPLEEQQQAKKKPYKNWKLYATALGIITVGLAVGVGVGVGVQNNSHNATSPQQKIVKEINGATYTLSTITGITTAENVTNQINNAEFLKTKLTNNNATAFKFEAFKLIQITVGEDNHILKDDDLTTEQVIKAKINYDYDSIKNQTTNLTISIAFSEDQKIVNAISGTLFALPPITTDATAKNVTDQITGDFIKGQLSDEGIQNSFNPKSFNLTDIKVGEDKHTLADTDLATAQTIMAEINYTYNDFKDQTTLLTITINATNEQIANAINNTKYTTTAYVGDTAKNVTDQITGDFIKGQLSDEGIQNSFNPKSFNLTDIKVGEDNHILKDDDLTTEQVIMAEINYTYNDFKDQTTLLTITINATNEQIANAINNTKYTTTAYVGDTAKNVTDQITGDFIKGQLSDEGIQNSFNPKSFNLTDIKVGEDNHILKDDDLTTEQVIKAKINYDYDSIKNQTTNLEITTQPVNEDVIINTIANTTFKVESALAGEAASIRNKITSDFISNTLSKISNGIAQGFSKGTFNLDSITIGKDNHILTDNDLLKVRDFDSKINYTYNSKVQSFNLTISIGIGSIITDGIDISKFVTDENRNLPLKGVSTTSSDNEIKDSITNALIPIIADILGDYWTGEIKSLIESQIANFIDITLDTNNPHQSATIKGSENAPLPIIKGQADVTFTLATA